jgi:hypothetical protein
MLPPSESAEAWLPDSKGWLPEDGSIRLPSSVFRPEKPECFCDSLYLGMQKHRMMFDLQADHHPVSL